MNKKQTKPKENIKIIAVIFLSQKSYLSVLKKNYLQYIILWLNQHKAKLDKCIPKKTQIQSCFTCKHDHFVT